MPILTLPYPDRTSPIDVTIPVSIGDQPGDLGRIGEAIAQCPWILKAIRGA